ncbi:MAG TPA: hypothetical protein PKC18_15510 [Lacipirellulaceae bacterium]|nr:hypothetical protein [Lacipirellulaceae bacterium]
MPVPPAQLEVIRDQALAQMQTLVTNEAPTIAVGDAEMPWAPLLAPLAQTVDWCDRKLSEYDPCEVRSGAA